LLLLLGLFALVGLLWAPVSAQQAMIRAVLFYSPTCPHCHIVMDEVLPPLQAQYGEQLQILEVNVQTPDGQRLYQDYSAYFSVPDNRQGVPALVVGDAYFVGSVEIPNFFPSLIEQGLAEGGIEWPVLNSMQAYLAEHGMTEPAGPSLGEIFSRDPLGNSISVVVLVALVSTAILSGYAFMNGGISLKAWPKWSIPALTLIGLGVASYLAFVEVTQTEAVCGPVGDCNAVQSSSYAYLFGVLPVAVLGLLGLISIGAAWAVQTYGGDDRRPVAAQALWGFAFAGVLFSIYLTYLEPFVIGATCAWCLTSAVVMLLILWAATPGAIEARHPARSRRGRPGYRRFRTRQAR
jgi:uncharacterized membrane protein